MSRITLRQSHDRNHAIFELLASKGATSCDQIAKHLGLPYHTTYQYLRSRMRNNTGYWTIDSSGCYILRADINRFPLVRERLYAAYSDYSAINSLLDTLRQFETESDIQDMKQILWEWIRDDGKQDAKFREEVCSRICKRCARRIHPLWETYVWQHTCTLYETENVPELKRMAAWANEHHLLSLRDHLVADIEELTDKSGAAESQETEELEDDAIPQESADEASELQE